MRKEDVEVNRCSFCGLRAEAEALRFADALRKTRAGGIWLTEGIMGTGMNVVEQLKQTDGGGIHSYIPRHGVHIFELLDLPVPQRSALLGMKDHQQCDVVTIR